MQDFRTAVEQLQATLRSEIELTVAREQQAEPGQIGAGWVVIRDGKTEGARCHRPRMCLNE